MTALELIGPSGPAEASPLILETRRLVLRAPRMADLDAIVALANNRKIAEMTASIPHPYREKDARDWLSNIALAGKGATFAVFVKDEDVFVGAAGYRFDDCGTGTGASEAAPELGYWIGEPYWNRGYATEAARAVLDHAFSEAGFDAVLASCRVTNLPSRRVLEKCGFQWTGAGLCRVRSLGASVPSDRFRLDRRTWEALRAWGATALPKRRGKKAR
jgi:RimJ/RimL family protein N-acetyltransferase